MIKYEDNEEWNKLPIFLDFTKNISQNQALNSQKQIQQASHFLQLVNDPFEMDVLQAYVRKEKRLTKKSYPNVKRKNTARKRRKKT